MKKIIILLSLLLLAGCGAKEHPPKVSDSLPVQGEAAILEEKPEEPTAPPEIEPEIAPEPKPELPPEPVIDPKTKIISTILDTMTLEEKVGQLFFARCPSADQIELLQTYHLGGYLLFLRDFKSSAGDWLTAEEFTAKIAAYQSASAIPLLIGVDEEGGSVVRASRNPNLFPSPFRSPQRLYRNGGMELIATDAFDKSAALLDLGINVNFAPVADVSQSSGDFIYDRTFGQDAEATAEYVAAVVREMESAGIGSVLKHFPGYGNNKDTHTGIAVDDRPYETFTSEDFLPFLSGMEEGADSPCEPQYRHKHGRRLSRLPLPRGSPDPAGGTGI